MQAKFYIYKITNRINGKIYIGKTNDLKERWYVHKSYSKFYKSKLYNSMRKYGIDNFSMEPIAEFDSEEQAYEAEMKFIVKYDSFNNGLNSSHGGIGCRSGELHPNFGKHLSKEVKLKISQTQKGGTGLNKDKIFTEETRKKISENRKGIPVSTQTKRKISLNKTSLSEDQILEIKRLLNEGQLKQKEIAEIFSTTPKCICLIKQGKRFSQF